MENIILKKIELAKQQDIVFNEIADMFTLSLAESRLSNDAANLLDASILEYKTIPQQELKETISFTIPTKYEDLCLELIEVPPSFYNYSVVTPDGIDYPKTKNIRHYRGVIRNNPDSLVAISFIGDELMGMIATNEGNYNLELDTKLGKHIFYHDKNLSQRNNFACETPDGNNADYQHEVLFEPSKTVQPATKKCIRIYLEAAFDIFQTKGSIGAVERFVAGIFNQVALLFENENIEIRLSDLFIWNTTDPYTANTTSGLLSQFQSYRTSFNGDLGQLLSFNPELGGGIAAGFDGLCNPAIAQRLSVSMIKNSYRTFPVFSLTVQIITHELGHLLGSRHTHACVWNGNNTAIDGCAGFTEGRCPLPAIPLGGGTIMSYCHLQPVGINFNLGFGPQPGNVIRNKVAAATCLCEYVDANRFSIPD